MAPEVVLGEPYGAPFDMWSIGVVLYMMFGKKQPFEHNDLDEAYPEDLTIDFESNSVWGTLGDDVKSLVSGLLIEEPSSRLTAERVCQHPWITKSK